MEEFRLCNWDDPQRVLATGRRTAHRRLLQSASWSWRWCYLTSPLDALSSQGSGRHHWREDVVHIVFRHDTSALTRHGFAENATCGCVIPGCLKQTASSCGTKIEDKKSICGSTYSLFCYNHPPTPVPGNFLSHTLTFSHSLFLSSLAEECAHTAQNRKKPAVCKYKHTHTIWMQVVHE